MGIVADRVEIDWAACDRETALAALSWQVDLGLFEATRDAPLNRYDLPEALPVQPRPDPRAAVQPVTAPATDAVGHARSTADAAPTLKALCDAMAAFAPCELRLGARSMVFADGDPAAPLMILADAPGREEDREGRAFTGAPGLLLDRMLAAIGRARDATEPARAASLAYLSPWRTPGEREPSAEEIAMLRPFLLRRIALSRPRVIVAMGNAVCQALLHARGLQRMRGTWHEIDGIPVMPMSHPAKLLRTPIAKREAWAGLLAVKSRLDA